MPLHHPFEYSEEWLRLQERSAHHHRRARHAVRLLGALPGVRRILDVGCGTGILVDLLGRRGFEAHGVDSSPVLIEYNRRHKAGRYFLSEAGALHSPDSHPYDLVVAAHLIEHLRDPAPFLDHVRACLVPRGYFYVETPNLQAYGPRSLWRCRCGGMAGGYDHRVLYTPAALTAMLERSGFEVCHVETWTYSPLILRNGLGSAAQWLRRPRRPVSANPPVNQGVPQRRSAARRILEAILNSTVVDWALLAPNRLSELNRRGAQVAVLARLRPPQPPETKDLLGPPSANKP